ncbi:unnamed protein product [Dimorphilus gyrociliatus]|uniref:Uncharacterized protein n=1 Tax=Dimorphilus gyrociliatus TaxID=2664684 RepID=A0A7I8VUR5_9ANNE|nr:unnamed protein product [Dimorphilus gyrociliatus]
MTKLILINLVFYCLYTFIFAQSLSDKRYFVVDLKWTGDLFNLREEANTDQDRFTISVQGDEQLFSVDEKTGVVQRRNDWGTEERELSIQINISRQSVVFTQTVNIKMVSRMNIRYHTILLKNQPNPLRGTVWYWTRPGTVVMTVEAIDSDFHKDGKLQYELADNGEGRFGIDNLGNIFVKGRKRFNGQYNLAVSVFSKGTIRTNTERTVVQPITIYAGSIRPQFYQENYNINLDENLPIGSSAAKIEIKSFQDLRVDLKAEELDTKFFQLAQILKIPGKSTYELRIKRQLVYGRADTPYVFRFFLVATEEVSEFRTMAEAVITLVDVNEPPFFTVERYEDYNVDPSSWSGIELTAFERDFGAQGQIQWSLDDSDNFELTEGQSGTYNRRSWTKRLVIADGNSVKYGNSPDHSYTVKVTATDAGSPPLNNTIDCIIRLKKMNSEPPKMEPPVQTVKLSKSIEQSSTNPIYYVQAYDPDGMANELPFKFRLKNDFGGLFGINGNTGAIYLEQKLTNPQAEYILDIEITQGNQNNLNAGRVVLQLVNINQPPKFIDCKSYINTVVDENEEPGKEVVQVQATDDDTGPAGELTYSFVQRDQGDEQFFEIDKTTGKVTTKRKFDREKPPNGRTNLRLTVQASDKGKPPQSTNCFFFVKIGDVNDQSPKFDVASTEGEGSKFYAPFNLPDGSFIAQLYAYDLDEFDTRNSIVKYSLTNVSPECTNCFIFSEEGEKSLNTAMIRSRGLTNKRGEYELTVTAEDDGIDKRTATTKIKIIVTEDVNFYPPKITNLNNFISPKSISETLVGGSTIVEGQATNHDSNAILFGVRSDLIPLLNSMKTFGYEDLGGGNFKIIYNVGKTLDREVQPKYLLIVTITGTQAAISVRVPITLIDENNKSPEFQGMDSSDNYRVLLPQNTAINNEILSFIATDDDSERNNNNKVSYTITGCTELDLETCKRTFKVSSILSDGFYFGSLVLSEEISADQIGNRFKLDIVAEDGSNSAFPGRDGPNKNKKSVRLHVTGISSHSPKFPVADYTYETVELASHGLSIANITAKTSSEQYDQYVEKTYAITGGNENRWFTVDSSTGNIYIAGNGLVNIDDLPQNSRKVSLEYKVFDGAVQSDVIVINITINDINKYVPYVTPNFDEFTNYIEMNAPAGTIVYTFESKDPDLKRSSQPNYENHCVTIPQRWRDYFKVEKDTANNAKNRWNILLNKPLERDYYDGYDRWVMNVQVKDECDRPATSKIGYGTFTILPEDINNHSPRFLPECLKLNVDEEATVLTNVKDFTVCTYDVDFGLNGQINENSFKTEGSRFFKFNRGLLQVNETIPKRYANRPETLSYSFVVKVKDLSGLSSNGVKVTVYVNDINNNPPQFTNNDQMVIEMDEELPVDTVVYTLLAEDKDIDENALRKYSIVGSSPFYIDSLYSQGGGAIRVRERIDLETGVSSYNFQVLVEHPDRGITSSRDVTVQVVGVNDNAPNITTMSGRYSLTIPENTEVSNNNLETFIGSDSDGDTFDWFIDYENSDVSRRFNIVKRDNVNADLKLIRELDRETIDNFSLVIMAVDNGSPPKTGSLTYSIIVGDVNDNAPEFAVDKEIIVPEEQTIGYELDAVIRITDRDSEDNGGPFTIERTSCSNENSACSSFDLERKGDNTYRIKTKKPTYDRYATKEYYLPVVISDSGTPPKTGTSTLTIVVEGLNKSPQERGATKYVTVYNYKYMLPDTSIGTPYSVDKDDWDLKDKEFTILNHNKYFEAVNDNTREDHGHIILKEGTKAAKYDLDIRISDNSRKGDVVESKMIVNVIYINEQAVKSPGSMTLTGITAKQFIAGEDNKRDKLRNSLASILGTSTENVDIFSIYDSDKDTTQILYAAHGSPWYDKSRLDGLASENREKLEANAGIKISQIPIDECEGDSLCYVGGCVTKFDIKSKDTMILNTNFSSQAQISARAKKVCECAAQYVDDALGSCTFDYCMNNGTCMDKYTHPDEVSGEPVCKCLPGFDGKRCQQLDHSFNGNGWAWYEPLSLCVEDMLSIDIVTKTGTGLLFYQGPLSTDDSKDYLALELNSGRPKLTVQHDNERVILNVPNARNLADGKWHSLQVSKAPTDRRMVRWTLMVDNCKDASVDENIDNSTENDSGCKSFKDVITSRSYLDNNNPLQLGGRKSVNFPAGIVKNGFNGCMKNLRHNGVVRDLYTGKRREQSSSTDGCPSISNKCLDCGGNATCVGDLTSSAASCVCKPGFTNSPSCNERTDSRKLKEKAYISWNLKDQFNTTISTTASRRNQRIQLRFRTRKEEGTIFSTSSFSTLEQIILSVSNGYLKLLYDLGSGYNTLSLPYVKVNDGIWHTVVFERFGNGGSLLLDDGDAPRFFVQNFQRDSHRLIAIEGLDISSGAMLQKRMYHNLPSAKDFFQESCISDVHYTWSGSQTTTLPLNENSNNGGATYVNRVNTDEGCPSGITCTSDACPSDATCVEHWEARTCFCGIGKNFSSNSCVAVTNCAVPQCLNGGLCAVFSNNWVCHCSENYEGTRCGIEPGGVVDNSTGLATGGIVGIILAILIALALFLVLAIWLKKRKAPEKVIIDHPETDENEFCYNYTEEGGGEEDTANFSTAELRKAVSETPFEPKKVSAINVGFVPEDSPYRTSPVSPYGPDGKPKNLGDFLSDRLTQADNDPTAPPYDTVREYEYEGGASQVGSLSSLASGSTDASIDYEPYMQGPRFDKLRDIYSGNDDADDIPIDESLA